MTLKALIGASLAVLLLALVYPLIQISVQMLYNLLRHASLETTHQTRPLPVYDFVIVGAGSAGCVLANRLSEIANWTVLLIEAGGSEHFFMDIPALVHDLQTSKRHNWKYRTEPSDRFCGGMKGRRCNLPRGKVMGGSSVLNFMVYTRGNRKDYDNWAALGNPGWSFKDVLPYFEKLEKTGVTITKPVFRSPASKAFVEAGRELGHPQVDYNGESQIGFSYIQTNIKDGLRQSSNVVYLHPIKSRGNVHILKNTQVTRLLMTGRRVTGVEYHYNEAFYTVNAAKEVVLSAGAIGSPHLMMLSGIGPAAQLQELGINVNLDLPVGRNLMDHVAPGNVLFSVNTSTSDLWKVLNLPNLYQFVSRREGMLALPGGSVEAIAFFDTKHSQGWADLELLFINAAFFDHPSGSDNFGIQDKYREFFQSHLSNYTGRCMVFPMVLRPKSRGYIALKSRDPFEYPLIFANYLDDPLDVEVALKGIRTTIDLVNTTAFRKFDAKLFDRPTPGCDHHPFNSDTYWECHMRLFTFTIYHQSGTCKMGPASDKTAVVDHRLRVHGATGLRVVDASIMPEIVAGHPNGPIMMIAEKAADMIKADWKYC